METERLPMGANEFEAELTESKTASVSIIPREKGEPNSTQLSRSGDLTENLGVGILRSMDSLNRAADKLIGSMEKSESCEDQTTLAASLVQTVEAQAKMVTAIADAMKTLKGV